MALNSCKKADLLQIAHQFSIAVTSGSRRDTIKTGCGHWLEKQILTDEDLGGKGSDSDSEGTVTEPLAEMGLEMKLKLE